MYMPRTLLILIFALFTKEKLTKPQGELYRAEIVYYWADLTGL